MQKEVGVCKILCTTGEEERLRLVEMLHNPPFPLAVLLSAIIHSQFNIEGCGNIGDEGICVSGE